MCILLLQVGWVGAQFGVPPKGMAEVQVNEEGDEQQKTPESQLFDRLFDKLSLAAPYLDNVSKANVVTMIEAARKDPETSLLARRMREGTGWEAFEAYSKDMSPRQIAHAMVQTVEELEMLEILFKDPHHALVEMEKEGLIEDKHKMGLYKKDPSLLEEDTKRGLYFTFVSLATAGGYFDLR